MKARDTNLGVTVERFVSEDTTLHDAVHQSALEQTVPVLELLYPRRLRFALDKPEIEVGRSASRDLPLSGKRVSRLHTRFEIRNGRVLLSDAGSRNGTFLNGSPASQAELCVGDVIRMGDWVGLFRRGVSLDEPILQHEACGILAGLKLQQLLRQADSVAATRLPVIIAGESGSGKELVARYLHERSGRSGDFVAINCAALPEALAESQLFGHERGAFTGAERQHVGAFRQAHRGTLLLDEVGDLPLSIQAKLLRALEESTVCPLGSNQPVSIDQRVLVAGQRPLQELVERREFRGDLFARLNGIALQVPPLRERREEVIELFLTNFERFGERPPPELQPEFAEALLLFDWPYNARQVVQLAHRMAALHADQQTLGVSDIPAELTEHSSRQDSGVDLQPESVVAAPQHIREQQRQKNLDQLREALARHGGNISRAAQALGISRGRAYRLLKANGSDEHSIN